ncbi:DUF4873 domain-containing protein [Streptomyces gardneri]|uniref:DUF4873 domain-containing protein n=1 Tax=Streptomyces gardneri TaxID=66892 RepID=UPI0033CEFCAD
MERYDGPATVTADGADFEVEASLEMTTEMVPVAGGTPLRGLSTWYGTLEVQDDEAAWNIHQADQALLRIDGRDGQFIVTNTQVGTNELTIKGSGPAPFGR